LFVVAADPTTRAGLERSWGEHRDIESLAVIHQAI
jgi:hypothetical protein